MWTLIQDFFDQNLVMKIFILWGWLSVLIMLTSLLFQ